MSRRATPGADNEVGYGKPPAEHRFVAGQSGNPTGRPKAPRNRADRSAFDVILEKRLTIVIDGQRREVPVEEALVHAQLQKAFAGDARAEGEVMKMIMRRDEAVGRSEAAHPLMRLRAIFDPENANEALAILGIAQVNEEHGCRRLNLRAWAVQAALDRKGRLDLPLHDQSYIVRKTVDSGQVRWPPGWAP